MIVKPSHCNMLKTPIVRNNTIHKTITRPISIQLLPKSANVLKPGLPAAGFAPGPVAAAALRGGGGFTLLNCEFSAAL